MSEVRPKNGCKSSIPKLIKKQKNTVTQSLALLSRVRGNRKPKGSVMITFKTTCLKKSPLPKETSINGTRFMGLNIIMTMPFGFLFPLTRDKKAKFSATVFSCFLMSLGIELLQPFFDRAADVTDLITNVIGGVLGYGFYAVFKPITFWVLERLKTR